MRRETYERIPALAGSIALHVGIAALALLLGALLTKPVLGPNVVPVTLINTADLNPPPAIETPTPTPSVTPPTPPTPDVTPTPLPPTPVPTPKPTPAKPAPTPPKPTAKTSPLAPIRTPKPAQTAPDDQSFLNNLSKDLSKGGNPSKPKPPSHPTPGTGTAPSAASLSQLKAQLERLWNPNCEVMGGSDITIVIKVTLGPTGRVISGPTSSAAGSNDPLTVAASDRAIRAAKQYFSDPSRPFANLPANNYAVNFNPKQYCSQH